MIFVRSRRAGWGSGSFSGADRLRWSRSRSRSSATPIDRPIEKNQSNRVCRPQHSKTLRKHAKNTAKNTHHQGYTSAGMAYWQSVPITHRPSQQGACGRPRSPASPCGCAPVRLRVARSLWPQRQRISCRHECSSPASPTQRTTAPE